MHIAMPVHLKGGIVLPGESLGINNLGAIVARLPSNIDSFSTSQQDQLLQQADSTELS